MSALTTIFMRHGEKPNRGFPGPGLTSEGHDDGESLVIRGWQRAGAWAALFGAGLGGTDYPSPGAVYAADPKKGNDDRSKRPLETASPLTARLGLEPILRFGVGEEAALVADLIALSGVALVFWEHKAITASIIPGLLGDQPLPGVPLK